MHKKRTICRLALIHCLILSFSAGFGQNANQRLAFVIENRNTHRQLSFVAGDKLRFDMYNRSVRGTIKAISDSSITINYWGQKTFIEETIKIRNIVSLARAKRTAPVVFGGLLLAAGAVSFAGGASLVNEPDPAGLVIFSNRSIGQAEMLMGGILIAGGVPLLLPRKKYKAIDWNFQTSAIK